MYSRTARSVASEGSFRRTIHVSDAKRAELLSKLTEIARNADLFDQDQFDQPEHRPITMRVTVHHPGGGSARFLVITHNFCSRGMWFLHSGFLNPKTRCVFILPRGDDQEGGVMGTVEQCLLIERNIHAVGVRFECEIDTEALLTSQRSTHIGTTSSLELPRLSATVLVLDDHRADSDLLAFHLRSTGLRLVSHRSLVDAVADAAESPPDLVICELNLADGKGEDALRVLHRAGAGGPAIVLTSETDPKRLKAAQEAGAYAIIPKPYDAETLIPTIVGALAEAKSRQQAPAPTPTPKPPPEPIFSSKSADEAMKPLIEEFVDHARALLADLARAIERDDAHGLRRICLSLKGSGSGYGFEALSDAAAEAVRKLDASGSIPDAMSELRRLLSLGPRLRADAPFGAPGSAEAA